MFAYVKMLYFSAAKIIKSGGGGNFIVGIVHFFVYYCNGLERFVVFSQADFVSSEI